MNKVHKDTANFKHELYSQWQEIALQRWNLSVDYCSRVSFTPEEQKHLEKLGVAQLELESQLDALL